MKFSASYQEHVTLLNPFVIYYVYPHGIIKNHTKHMGNVQTDASQVGIATISIAFDGALEMHSEMILNAKLTI